ncbi:MAG: reprolysin-like metallopeptidase [Pyrinomonadaceae bacterium]
MKIFDLAVRPHGRSCVLFLALALTAILASGASAQSRSGGNEPGKLWKSVDAGTVPERGRRQLSPERSRAVRLNTPALKGLMRSMPLEFTDAARVAQVIMEVPMPDGSISRFRIENSPVLAPHLSEAVSTWRTFHGYGIDDPTATARFDWTSKGFHGYVLTSTGTVYIDPMQENDLENYLVYYKHEYGQPSGFRCGVDELGLSLTITDLEEAPTAPAFAHGSNIRTYRFAVATTGEWSRGTTTSTDPQTIRTAALAALTTSVNRLDGIFRREIAVSLQLVNPPITNDATNIIFDDPATDPYDNTDSEAQLNINQTTVNNRVGVANYDVGHLYGTGGGGVASSPSVCAADAKAQGYSARAGFYGDPFTVDYAAHEVGHQFGGSHTYNNMDNGGACTTRSTMNAFEVASGSTLMSYVGICNIRNLQQYVDGGTPAFHIRSLTQMVTNIQDPGNGGSCGTPAGTNAIPTVNAGASYTIPKLTPFTLTATGSDADAGDVLSYSWEQYDLSAAGTGQLGTPALGFDVDTDGVQRSLFRAYSPVASNSRTFPSLAFILNTANNNPAGSNNPALTYQGTHPTGAPGATCQAGTDCVIGESLPSIARTMNYRVAVRDQRGGTADAGMTVTTVNTSGPFQITSQATATNWAVGSTQTITWDVVGSDAAPINAANVNILLSTNGGQSFPITLLANATNNGTATVTVPDNAATNARVKVQSAGNIFFDINNADIAITGGAPAVSVGNATGGEGPSADSPEGAPLAFTVSLSSPSAQTVTVRVNTNGITATEGGDFESVDNLDVVFPPGTVTRTVSVPIVEDPGDEPDETFSLDVASATNAGVADGQGIGTIVDDDPPTVETVEFTEVNYFDDESQSAVITIERFGDLTNASSVTFSTIAGGTATAAAACGSGGDYQSNSGQTVNFAVGESSKTVNVALCGDTLIEGDETVLVRLTNPAGAALGTPNVATITINDTANQYRNTTAISTFQGVPAAPYPSNIAVTGAPTGVQRIRVTLYDFYHAFPDNIKVLLVNPQGRRYILMADAGGPIPVADGSNVTLTFSDNAGAVLPNSTALTTGDFEPTNWETVINDFQAPAPAGPYPQPGSSVGGTAAQTLFGNFGLLDGNGTWSLYIRDDNGGNAPLAVNGGVNGGWGLELLASTAAGVEVSGRVTTPDGRGLRNAIVSMVDNQGVVRTATTSSFGYYSFDGIEAGSSVVMSVESRRYRFAPRIIQVIDTLTDVDFQGQE